MLTKQKKTMAKIKRTYVPNRPWTSHLRKQHWAMIKCSYFWQDKGGFANFPQILDMVLNQA